MKYTDKNMNFSLLLPYTGLLGLFYKQHPQRENIDISKVVHFFLFLLFSYLLNYPFTVLYLPKSIGLIIYNYPTIFSVIGLIVFIIGKYILWTNPYYYERYPILSRVVSLFLDLMGFICLVFLLYKTGTCISNFLNIITGKNNQAGGNTPPGNNQAGGSGSGGGGPSGGGPSGPSGPVHAGPSDSRKRRRPEGESSSSETPSKYTKTTDYSTADREVISESSARAPFSCMFYSRINSRFKQYMDNDTKKRDTRLTLNDVGANHGTNEYNKLVEFAKQYKGYDKKVIHFCNLLLSYDSKFETDKGMMRSAINKLGFYSSSSSLKSISTKVISAFADWEGSNNG